MASPQLENGYARIANEIMLALARTKLSGREMRVLFAVIEQTYGRHRKAWWLSLGLLAERTGISRGNCGDIVKRLVRGGYLVEGVNRDGHRTLGPQKDYERWAGYTPRKKAAVPDLGTPLYPDRVQSVYPPSGTDVYPSTGTKEDRIKEDSTVVVTRATENETRTDPTPIPDRVRKVAEEVSRPGCWSSTNVRAVGSWLLTDGEENVVRAFEEAALAMVNPARVFLYVRAVLENQRACGYTWEKRSTGRIGAIDITNPL